MTDADMTTAGTECWKCLGVGMVSVYVGSYGGSVECDVCSGTGVFQYIKTDTERLE